MQVGANSFNVQNIYQQQQNYTTAQSKEAQELKAPTKEAQAGVMPQNPQERPAMDDETRKALVAYAGHQSKMTQAEIYLEGMGVEDVDLTKSTDALVKGFMDAKKQNDAVAAYANAEVM